MYCCNMSTGNDDSVSLQYQYVVRCKNDSKLYCRDSKNYQVSIEIFLFGVVNS